MASKSEKQAASKNQLKQQMRNAKKYYKKTTSLLKEYDNVTVCDSPTRCLFIGNGGMLCGVDREHLLSMFGAHGAIADLVMLPRKSFAFLQYQNQESAEKSIAHLNGYAPANSQTTAPFYIQFINRDSLEFAKDDGVSGDYCYPVEEGEAHQMVDGVSLLQEFITEEYENKLYKFFCERCSTQGTLLLIKVHPLFNLIISFP